MIIRTKSCTSFAERSNFDTIFRKIYGRDSGLEIRASFIFLENKNNLPHMVLSIVYAQMKKTLTFVPFLHSSLQKNLENNLFFMRG
jgi:hypothetical protein